MFHLSSQIVFRQFKPTADVAATGAVPMKAGTSAGISEVFFCVASGYYAFLLSVDESIVPAGGAVVAGGSILMKRSLVTGCDAAIVGGFIDGGIRSEERCYAYFRWWSGLAQRWFVRRGQ